MTLTGARHVDYLPHPHLHLYVGSIQVMHFPRHPEGHLGLPPGQFATIKLHHSNHQTTTLLHCDRGSLMDVSKNFVYCFVQRLWQSGDAQFHNLLHLELLALN